VGVFVLACDYGEGLVALASFAVVVDVVIVIVVLVVMVVHAIAIAIAVESAIVPQTNLVLRIPGIGKYSSMETAVVIIMVSSRSYGTAAIIDYCFQPAGTNLAPGHVAVEGWC